MNESDYDAWQARIADARAARRRKKGGVNAVTADVRQRWDSASPPLKFDDLIDTWQRTVLRFVQSAKNGKSCQEAWNEAAPSRISNWENIDPAWRYSIQEVCDGL